MEKRGVVTCTVQRGEKFKILLITEHVPGKQTRKLSVYRRHEYGEWPQAVIDTICGAFGKLYTASEKPGVMKAFTLALSDRPDTAVVLFSTGNETRDPYKGRPIFYNERPAESVLVKDLHVPSSEKEQDAISVRRQRSEDGLREILVISKIMNPDEPINVWQTKTLSVARLVRHGEWDEVRTKQIVDKFDRLYERYSEGGNRQSMILAEPHEGRTCWILSYVSMAETPHGTIYALSHEPE
jgi:hypothetical protein